MSETPLNADNDFQVRESIEVNYFMGILIFIIFSFASILSGNSWENYIFLLALFLIPAAFYLSNARKNSLIIKVNKDGIFYKNQFLTDWNNFVDATLTQDEIVGSIRDNFIIILRYYNKNSGDLFSMKIPLSNTQDKDDEEIIEAIQFYYDHSRREIGETAEEKN